MHDSDHNRAVDRPVSATELHEEVAMRDDAGVNTVCCYQNMQHLLEAEHRLREVIALARQQLMHCQHALDQLAEARKCSLLRHSPLESSSAWRDTASQVRHSGCHDNGDCTRLNVSPADVLTAREAEVLHFISAGMSNRAIADALFLSPRTVERHIANIYLKIDVHSKAEATAFARHHHSAWLQPGYANE
jgi:DNA-binding NarL/FixJ family response regulator